LSQLVSQSDLLEKIKPRQVENDFSKAGLNKEGDYQIQNERFKTRVRQSDQVGQNTSHVVQCINRYQRVIMTDMNNCRFEGTATRAKGKTTTIRLKGQAPSGILRSIRVIGLPDPTNSERARDELIYLLLTGQKSLQESSFIQRLWFPHSVGRMVKSHPEKIVSPMGLNDSQCTAMRAMVGKSPIVIVHGTFYVILAFMH
jgi:hypothetical protein